MGDYSIKMTGADLLNQILKSTEQPEFMQSVAAATFAEASDIMLTSKAQVPLEYGTLRRSGVVNEPVVDGTKWSVTLGYGGEASAYALVQHENLSFQHPGPNSIAKGQSGRGAKYLEEPVAYDVPKFEANLAKRVVEFFAKRNGVSL